VEQNLSFVILTCIHRETGEQTSEPLKRKGIHDIRKTISPVLIGNSLKKNGQKIISISNRFSAFIL